MAEANGVRRISRGKRRKALGVLVALAIAIAGLGGAQLQAAPAEAAVDQSLPTWDEVQKAKQNEAAADSKVTEIEALIVQVEAEVEKTRAESEEAGTALVEAEQDLLEAQQRADSLESQAAKSAEEADEAAEQAASLVSQMYRSGGVDRNAELFLESDESTADTLLERLASMSKATERNTKVSEEASQAMNNAASLGQQAESAKAERDRLRGEAEQRKEEAVAAATAASDKLIEQEDQLKTLETQLAALQDKTTSTVEGYEKRLQQEEAERQRIAEEARRAAEEEARRWAEQNGGGGGGGGGGGWTPPPGGGGGGGGGGGWQTPIARGAYYVSDWWGAARDHTGVDLAPYAGAGVPIRAAGSGTVTMAGWMPPCYANMVEVTHGGGLATRYAHMISHPVVSVGQYVNAGQIIGYVGSTGCSTGPHLHFETYTWGYPVDPVPIMGARGVGF